MKILMLALTLTLGLGSHARAVLKTIDVVPAATLLLPYFEVDPNATATSGTTTSFTINNADAAAVLAHVTVWTDYGIAILPFDVYLTGYDSQTIDLSQVFAGQLPRTASLGQDSDDLISPQGPVSQDINHSSCNGVLPYDPLPAALVTDVRAELSGKPSERLGGNCASRNVGDGLLRGYITVDVVLACSLLLPGTPGYFGITTTNQNVLWGDWRILDRTSRRTIASNLVHIEADATTFVPGDYTFYGRHVAWVGSDAREPLANIFGVRYGNTTANAFPAKTSLIVWRDHKTVQSPIECGQNPAWFPLFDTQIVVFDDQENVDQPGIFDPPLIPFPVATQRVQIGGEALPSAFDRGWIFLNLDTQVASAGSNPPGNPNRAQAWIEVVHEEPDVAAYGVRGHVVATQPAIQFSNAGS